MSSTLSLCWDLLANVGQLPDELIVKILYEHNGLKHPIVKLLYNETKIDKYERLKNLPFSRSIQNHYYKYGLDDNLISIMNNKQTHYHLHNCTSYIHWNDPGYFIRRENGRLHYNVLNETLNVIDTSFMNLWKLNRSKKIIENIKCRCGKFYIHDSYELNSLTILLEIHGNYATMLKYIERLYNINQWLCNYCYNTAFNEWKCDISDVHI
jgi:hypothetical protein